MLNYSKKIITIFIALSFLFSACELPLASAARLQDEAVKYNLAKPTYMEDKAHQTIYIVSEGATRIYYAKKSDQETIDAANNDMAVVAEALQRSSDATKLPNPPKFTEVTWDDAKKSLIAAYILVGDPDKKLYYIYLTEDATTGKPIIRPISAQEATEVLQAMQMPSIDTEKRKFAARFPSTAPAPESVESFFALGIPPQNLPTFLCDISNRRLASSLRLPELRVFLRGIIDWIGRHPEYAAQTPEVRRNIQLMASRALFILSQIEDRVPNAEKMRLTADTKNMVKSPDNPKRSENGPSFLDIRLVPANVTQAQKEGEPGIYNRGCEGIGKMTANVLNPAGPTVYNPEELEAARASTVLYDMTHGRTPVTPALQAITAPFTTENENSRITPFHDRTAFLTKLVPGTICSASTGAGHFQGVTLDIKYIKEGYGIQWNKVYNEEGKLVKVYAQYLEPGTWAVAIPGAVESIENLGGLVFEDFTVKVSPEVAAQFNRDLPKLEAAQAFIDKKSKEAVPYSIVWVKGKPYILKYVIEAQPEIPPITWVKPMPRETFVANSVVANSARELYNNLNGIPDIDRISEAVAQLAKPENWRLPIPEEPAKQPENLPKPITPTELAKYAEALKIAEASRPIISEPTMVGSELKNIVCKFNAWAGRGIAKLLGIPEKLIAELWFWSTQKDGRSPVPGTNSMFDEVVAANPEKMLGPGIKYKSMFCKILGKDSDQPQIVHLGFNEKIREVGKEKFIGWLVEERRLATELKDRLATLLEATKEPKERKKQFDAFQAAYAKWVSDQTNKRWTSSELPALPAFMAGFDRAIFKQIQANRANIVSVMNEIKLKPGQVILSPVGYIHSIVGSHQMHPIAGPEAKNEAWYIFPIGNELLYFEPQQTSNTTFSPFDFPTPIAWQDNNATAGMRKELPKIISSLLTEEEKKAAERNEMTITDRDAIRIMIERALKYDEKGELEVANPQDFIVAPRDVTRTASYENPIQTKVESLIEGTSRVWPQELFVTRRITMEGKPGAAASITVNPIGYSYHEIIVLSGTVTVEMPGEATRKIGPGSSIFVPYAYRDKYKIKSNEKAEIMHVYPGRMPEGEEAEISLKEIEASVAEETGEIGSTVHKTVTQAEVDKGVVILAIDENIYNQSSLAVATMQELVKLINRTAKKDPAGLSSVVVIKGKGAELADKINTFKKDSKLPVRSIVTQLNEPESITPEVKKIQKDLADLGVVLSMNLKEKSPANHYMQVIRFFDLSLRVAYSKNPTEDRDVIAALSKICIGLDRLLTPAELAKIFEGNIWRILPMLKRGSDADIRKGYNMAKQAVSAL